MKISKEDAYNMAVNVIKVANVKDGIGSSKKVVYGFLDRDANIVSACVADKFVDMQFINTEYIMVQAVKYEWFWDVMLQCCDDNGGIVWTQCYIENLNKSREEIAHRLYEMTSTIKSMDEVIHKTNGRTHKDVVFHKADKESDSLKD